MNDLLAHWQSQLEAIALSAVADDGAHDLQHLHRVWYSARKLLPLYPDADALVVLASCYLHDLVNLPKTHVGRTQASRQAATLAVAKLTEAGFPADRLPAVAHAIEAHSFAAAIAPQTIEAQIVQDADRLDALGAIGLARLYYTAGRMGSALAHPSDPAANRRTPDDRAYALDHIECKLATLPAAMQTEAGRLLADKRLAWLREFRECFLEEWAGTPL